jgi:hypothetical protein
MNAIPECFSIIIDIKSFFAVRAIELFHLKTAKNPCVFLGFRFFSTDWAFHASSNISIEHYIII